jgi:N-acetylmuramic acid 6-phosphate etherase
MRLSKHTGATEAASRRYLHLDTWEDADILAALWESQADALAAVRAALPAIAAAADAARKRLRTQGRLAYVGAGTSGRLGFQDGVELGPTFDWPDERLILLLAGGPGALRQGIEGAEDDEAAARDQVAEHAIGADDVVLGVAASGRTPFTHACLAAARTRGALTIALANAPGPVLDVADHPILVETGGEVIAGSTRLKAGTAQKVVLNLFSTLLMTRLGRVHDNRMVDMRLSNAKLRRRAADMVSDLSGCDALAAAAALDAAGGRIKPAVLVASGLTPDAAEALLARHEFRLRPALDEARA